MCAASKPNQCSIQFLCNLVTLELMTIISSSPMQLMLIRYDRLAGRKKTPHITSLSLINVSVAAFY